MPWVQIGGPATSLITGETRIFATNPGTGNVWQYDDTPMHWSEIGGPGSQFVSCWNYLYGLTPDRRGIWEYRGIPWRWIQISHDRPIGRLISSHDFEPEPGTSGVRPVLYATDQASGNLLRYSGTHLDGTVGSWVEIGGPGSMFVEVYDRSRTRQVLYGLAPDRSGIWEYTDTPWQWRQVGGPATTVVAGWERLLAMGPDSSGWHEYRGTPMQWLPLAVPIDDPIATAVQSLRGGTLILTGYRYAEFRYYLTPDGEHVWANKTREFAPPNLVHTTRWVEIGGAARTIAAVGDNLVALHPGEGNVMLFTWPRDVEITDNVLPQARVGSDYSYGLRVRGGSAPYLSWERTSLPNGMGLWNNRIIGRPTAAGNTSFEVVVSDTIGTTATKQLSITVEPAETPPPSSTTPAPSGALTVSLAGNVPILYDHPQTQLTFISPTGQIFLKRLSITHGASLTRSETNEAGTWELVCTLAFQIPLTDSVSPNGTSVFSNVTSPKRVPWTPAGGDAVYRFNFEYTPASAGESSRSRFVDF